MQNNILYILDIGSYSVKLVKVAMLQHTVRILNAYTVALKFNVTSGIKTDSEKLHKAIQQLFAREPQATKKNISVLLSNHTIFTRFVTLPNISRSKLSQIIHFEAEQQIPFVIEEVTWAYTVIPLSYTQELSVMIAAIRNKEMDDLATLFRQLNITINTFGISHLAYVNLVKFCKFKEKNILLIDIGDEVTSLIFLSGNKTWGRNILVGGAQLNTMLTKEMGVDFMAAEKLKTRIDLTAEDETADHATVIGKNFANHLISEITRTITFYTASTKNAPLEKILLTGGSSALRGLPQMIKNRLGIASEIFNWVPFFDASAHMQTHLKQQACSFGSAVGLALSFTMKHALSINLLPQQEKDNRLVAQTKKHVFVLVAAISIVITVLSVLFASKNAILLDHTKRLQEKSNYYIQCTQHDIKITKELASYTEKLDSIAHMVADRTLLLYILERLNAHLPDNIWFKSIQYDGETGIITIAGFSTGTLADIDYFKNAIVQENIFSTATIKEANIADSTTGNATPTRIFTLIIQTQRNAANNGKSA